jgi:hypothetical protein
LIERPELLLHGSARLAACFEMIHEYVEDISKHLTHVGIFSLNFEKPVEVVCNCED